MCQWEGAQKCATGVVKKLATNRYILLFSTQYKVSLVLQLVSDKNTWAAGSSIAANTLDPYHIFQSKLWVNLCIPVLEFFSKMVW